MQKNKKVVYERLILIQKLGMIGNEFYFSFIRDKRRQLCVK